MKSIRMVWGLIVLISITSGIGSQVKEFELPYKGSFVLYSSADEKKFEDLISLWFTSSSLATEKRKFERIKDLVLVWETMMSDLFGAINKFGLGNDDTKKSEHDFASDVKKYANNNVKSAHRYAIYLFGKEFQDKFNLTYERSPGFEDRVLKAAKTAVGFALNSFNENHEKIIKALKELKVTLVYVVGGRLGEVPQTIDWKWIKEGAGKTIKIGTQDKNGKQFALSFGPFFKKVMNQ